MTVVLDSDAEEAGFVQIVRGRVDDPERLRTLMEGLGGTLHEERPEITWATTLPGQPNRAEALAG